MKRRTIHRAGRAFAGALCACLAAAGCDMVAPVDDEQVVVEGFINAGRPLEPVRVRRTLSPRQPYDAAQAAVSDAAVEMRLGGKLIRYAPDPGRPGRYLPEEGVAGVAAAGDAFSFSAVWRDAVVRADGFVPPEIEILAVSLEIPEEPVSAVLLDTLALADALALSDTLATGAYTGYIYPVEATVEWAAPDAELFEEESWVRAQLQPFTAFSSPILDLFLRSDEAFREDAQEVAGERKTWTGVYAVSVPGEGDPLPPHGLRVSLVRSGPDYARFAASRGEPDQREPVSGVRGGIGVFAAVSVDSAHVQVDGTGGAFPAPR